MARSFAAAFAAVSGPEFDAAVGYTVAPPRRLPTDAGIDAAFTGLDYEPFQRIARRLTAHQRCEPGHGEEAVQEGLAYLLERERRLFYENPLNWLGLLYKVAKYRLYLVRRGQGRAASIEALKESGAEDLVDRATPCVAAEESSGDGYRDTPAPAPGEEWSRTQTLGALQRFYYHRGHAPRARECGPGDLLPSETTIRRQFGSLAEALLAAGIVPETTRRRKRWGPVEAAEACFSFRRRNLRWPDGTDADRNPGTLPGRAAMLRFFGGTGAAEVQIGAEEIVAAGD